ncbi:hypothetical protein LTR02_017663 [Friedmanniomyces endolithicus]|nr:hypothetical protein LTR02_017663 [Friedmanniomyces endolithicus]
MGVETNGQDNSPKAVLMRFYDAERRYMTAGGKAGGASFDEFASTMDPNIVLHQTPDLPWGGEYVGVDRYADWAAHMSSVFDVVHVQDAEFLETADKVVVLCTLHTTDKRGDKMAMPMVQVVTVENGLITNFRPYYWHVPSYVAASEASKKA